MSNKKTKDSFLGYYLENTHTYAYSLILVIPLILTYEVGMRLINEHSWGSHTLLADQLIMLFFEKLGFARPGMIPALLVMMTLFIFQFRSKKKWEINFSNGALLYVESLVYAIVFFFSVAWLFEGSISFRPPYGLDIIMSLGAGVYEEFLFRFIILGLLMVILEKGLKVEENRRVYVSVLLSAVLFAAFHNVLGSDSFQWSVFLVRVAAGIVFGFIALTRGYGVAAVSHAGFNMLYVCFIR